jgi:flagellar basal-body rod modification protein FlgD
METNIINSVAPPTDATNRKPSPDLDKNAFLQLMVAQLQHQDPTAPADANAMMNSMSQMSTVEQLTNLATTAAAQAKDIKMSRSEALVGHTVTYINADKQQVTGVVQAVDVSGDAPKLTIDGVADIDPATLSEVR